MGALAGLDFILNVILDEKRRMVGAFAGHFVAAHRAGVALGRRLTVTTVPEKADLLLAALGGSPRDADFWQAEGKAMMHTRHLVRDGGVLVLVAGCEKGIGGQVWRDLLQKTSEDILAQEARETYSVPMMKAADTVRTAARVKLWLVCPGVKPEDIPHLPVRFFPNVAQAAEAARALLPNPAAVIVVPDASRVVVTEDAACELRR